MAAPPLYICDTNVDYWTLFGGEHAPSALRWPVEELDKTGFTAALASYPAVAHAPPPRQTVLGWLGAQS